MHPPKSQTQYLLSMVSNKGIKAKEIYDQVKDYIYSINDSNPNKDSLVSAINQLNNKIYDADKYSKLIDENIGEIPINIANQIKNLYKSALNKITLDETLKSEKSVVENNTKPLDKDQLDGINNQPAKSDTFIPKPELPPMQIESGKKDLF